MLGSPAIRPVQNCGATSLGELGIVGVRSLSAAAAKSDVASEQRPVSPPCVSSQMRGAHARTGTISSHMAGVADPQSDSDATVAQVGIVGQL
jgi:hypothetical protein